MSKEIFNQTYITTLPGEIILCDDEFDSHDDDVPPSCIK